MQKAHTKKRFFLRLHEILFIYLFLFLPESVKHKSTHRMSTYTHENSNRLLLLSSLFCLDIFSLIQCNISRCLFVFAEAVWCKVWLGFFVIFFSPSLVDFLSTSLSLIFLIFDHKISKNNPRNWQNKNFDLLLFKHTNAQAHTLTHMYVRAQSHPEFFLRVCIRKQRERKNPSSVQIDHVKAQTIPNRTNNNKQHQKPNTVCVWSLLFWRNGNERSEKQSDSRDMKFKSSKREKETHTEHRAQAQHNKNEIHTCIASDHNNKLDYKKTLTNIHTATIEETQLACM